LPWKPTQYSLRPAIKEQKLLRGGGTGVRHAVKRPIGTKQNNDREAKNWLFGRVWVGAKLPKSGSKAARNGHFQRQCVGEIEGEKDGEFGT